MTAKARNQMDALSTCTVTRAIGKVRAETVQGWNNKEQTNKGIARKRINRAFWRLCKF